MLKYRVMTGGGFLALVAGMYKWSDTWAVAVLLLVLTGLAVMEVVSMLSGAGFPALKWTTLAVSLLWMSGAWYAEVNPEQGSALKGLLPAVSAWAIFLGCLFRSDQSKSLEKIAGSFFTLAYIPGLMQFILLMMFLGESGKDGRSLLLYGILVVKSTDMGAYFTGRAIGKHKLIPKISPAKTWEGVMGGLGVAVAVSSLIFGLYGYKVSGIPFTVLDGIVLGALLAVAGILGDLVESMLKRSAEVKDSGTWLKGLGGIMDVLDSLIFALPVLYFYVTCLH
jgi:phosphatidate cytidylyltransferase